MSDSEQDIVVTTDISSSVPPIIPFTPPKNSSRKKLIPTFLGLLLLIGGLGAGVVLVSQPQLLEQRAQVLTVDYDCDKITNMDMCKAPCKVTTPKCLEDWRANGTCPKPNCALFYIYYQCSEIHTLAECNLHVSSKQPNGGPGCAPTFTTAYCVGDVVKNPNGTVNQMETSKNKQYCTNQGINFCTVHDSRCSWVPKKFKSCDGGTYVMKDAKWCQNTGGAYCSN